VEGQDLSFSSLSVPVERRVEGQDLSFSSLPGPSSVFHVRCLLVNWQVDINCRIKYFNKI
jgi:hypothetical protein